MARRALFVALVLGVSANAWGLVNLSGSTFRRPIQSITVSPMMPRSTDSVTLTLKGWKTAGFEVHDADVWIVGNTIHLSLFWNLPVLTDWNSVAYEYNQAIGTLSPGTYKVEVSYSGAMIATGTMSFTVLAPLSNHAGSLFPWSWLQDLLSH
jgi:hypothetical protein